MTPPGIPMATPSNPGQVTQEMVPWPQSNFRLPFFMAHMVPMVPFPPSDPGQVAPDTVPRPKSSFRLGFLMLPMVPMIPMAPPGDPGQVIQVTPRQVTFEPP